MTLQLFIPGVDGIDAAGHLSRVGLGDLLAPNDDPPAFFESTQTPTSGSGVFYSWAKATERGYIPTTQQWRPALADPDRDLPAGRYWWSVPSRPLAPDDFARRSLLDGPAIACQDGHRWQFPNGILLPHGHGLDDNGRFCRKVQKQYERIYELTRWAMTHWEAAIISNTFDFAACWRVSVELLQANYRITRDVVSELGLFGDETVQRVMMLCSDSETLLAIQDELQKKRPQHTPAT